MTYSCARFERGGRLPRAGPGRQARPHLPQARPARAARRMRLLDVGCGWGAMALHAASTYGTPRWRSRSARPRRAQLGARRRGGARGPGRGPPPGLPGPSARPSTPSRRSGCSSTSEPSAWSSTSRRCSGCCRPAGGCSTTPSRRRAASKMAGRTFMNRYVFPDGELHRRRRRRSGDAACGLRGPRRRVAARALCADAAALGGQPRGGPGTRRSRLVGEARARVWRLYMAASANGFEDGGLAIHQVLGVRPTASGESGMPRTRRGWN